MGLAKCYKVCPSNNANKQFYKLYLYINDPLHTTYKSTQESKKTKIILKCSL